MEASLVQLFPAPLLIVQWPDSCELNQALKELVLTRKGQDKGISTTNVGGWHSKKDLQEWNEPCVRALLERMLVLGHHMNLHYFGSDSGKEL